MNTQQPKIVIHTNGTYRFLQLDEILRVEADGSYTYIYLANNEKICSCKNIGHYKGVLLENGFFNTHKSHIVNIDRISSYSKEGIVTMLDGSTVPLARRRKDNFNKEVLQKFCPTNYFAPTSPKLIHLSNAVQESMTGM